MRVTRLFVRSGLIESANTRTDIDTTSAIARPIDEEPSALNVGTFRYRDDGISNYLEVCMIGNNFRDIIYEWVPIVTKDYIPS